MRVRTWTIGRALAVAGLALAAARGEAGPWATDPGQLYVKMGFSRLSTTELRSPDGTLLEIPEFTREEGSFYGEWAFAPRLAARLDLPFHRRSKIEGFDSASGFGDVRLGLQAELARGQRWRLGVLGIVQAPSGDADKGEGLLPTGSGAWEGDLLLTTGRSFGGGWAQIEAGYRVRGDGLRDSFVFDAQLGINAGSWLLLEGNFRGVEPWQGDSEGRGQGSAAGLGDGVRYLEAGPSAVIKFKRGWSVQLDAARSFAAENIATGWTGRVGIAWSR